MTRETESSRRRGLASRLRKEIVVAEEYSPPSQPAFDREEIGHLAAALSRLYDEGELTETDRLLLVAIFAAAGEHVTRIPSKEAKNLKDELINAFVPADWEKAVINCWRVGPWPPSKDPKD